MVAITASQTSVSDIENDFKSLFSEWPIPPMVDSNYSAAASLPAQWNAMLMPGLHKGTRITTHVCNYVLN